MKRPSRVAALLLVLATAGLGATAPASAATPSDAVVVSASPANSGDLAAGEALHVQVSVSNPNSVTTNKATATLLVDRTPFTSRDALADWFAGTSKASLAGTTVGSTPVPSIASGLTTGAQLSAAPSSLPFGARGVYAIAVRISSGSDVLGITRSAVIWNVTTVAAVPVAIAVPLIVPATESEFLTSAELAQYTGPDGILTRELADVTDSQIAVGLDPRVIASIRVLGDTVPASAKQWLDQVAALPNETFPLAWADADLTAPLRAGQTGVLQPKSLAYAINPNLFPAATGSTPSPAPTDGSSTSVVPTSASLVKWDYTLPGLGWPAENSVEATDLPKLSAAGITSTILDTSNLDGLGSRGLSGASGKSGTASVMVSDDTLSSYLRSALESPSHATSTEAMTQLSATLALISLESGRTPRTILLTLNRNWAGTDTGLVHTVGEMYERPWVSSAVLSSAFSETPVSLRLDKDTETTSRISLVATMLAAERRVVQFAPVAATPEAITSGNRLQLLSMLSNEWTDTPSAWTTAAKGYVTQTNKVVDAVQVAQSSRILGLADQLELPISITNDLDQDVTINLLVHPTTPRVSVDKKDKFQTITIGANSQRRIQIPIQALSNGKAKLVVSLTSATGVAIGKAVTLEVNVQAGWETLGTLIFVALIVALFAFGIVRNIRKRRAEAAARDVDGPADKATA